MADQILNVLLYDNPLTPDPNDRIGLVKLNGTWYNTTIARKIVEQRSELRYETILSVLNVSDEYKRMALATGNAVSDGVAYMHPAVPGPYKGDGAQFNPDVNYKTVSMRPTHEMRKAIEASRVEVVGPALTGPVINRVYDVFSDKEDRLLTPGRNLRIFGQRLRIAGDDPAVIGVWFISADETATRTRVDDRDVVDNNPSSLTVVIPTLAPGDYFVEVTTRSMGYSKTLHKTPRSYLFNVVLTVE